jgi:glycosyltransferase involved in cell wall biosynthesis
LFGQYDVVHYHALGPSVFLLLPRFFGIHTIVTVHGLNYKTPKWKGMGEKFIQLGEKVTAKYADEIIVLSKEQQKYFLEKYGKKATFIPNGTAPEPPLEANEIFKRFELIKNSYILFVSRLVQGKGLEHLIEAYKKSNLQLPLIIAGDAAFVDEFVLSIHKSISEDERIHCVGFVSGKILHELYSNAKLFVFPSEAEGMPMCLLEAMSFNARCLVSDIPENIEVGGNFVQTFKTADVNDLKEQLEKCLIHGDKLFPSGCREYILENYNWDYVVQKTLQCYGSALCQS